MNPNRKRPGRRFTVDDLDAILDERAGLTGSQDRGTQDRGTQDRGTQDRGTSDPAVPNAGDPNTEEEKDFVDDLPLPTPGLEDRVVAELRSMQARIAQESEATARVTASGGRPRRLLETLARPAALIPLSILLLGSVPTYWFFKVWNAKDDHNLSFEDAHDVAFDPNYSEESRHVAAFHLARKIQAGITLLRQAMARDPQLVTPGRQVLDAIVSYVDHPRLTAGAERFRNGNFAEIEGLLQNSTSTEELKVAFTRFLRAAQSGIATVHRATLEPGLIGKSARKAMLPGIKRYIRRPLQPPKVKPGGGGNVPQ